MAFSIHTSNRLEILAQLLAQQISKPLKSPLAPEVIVVQSRGMERWISLELARYKGISANCRFPFPDASCGRASCSPDSGVSQSTRHAETLQRDSSGMTCTIPGAPSSRSNTGTLRIR